MNDAAGPSTSSAPLPVQHMAFGPDDPNTWLTPDYSLKNVITPLDDNYPLAFPESVQQQDPSLAGGADPNQPGSSKMLVGPDGQLIPKRKIIPYDVRKLIKDFWPSRKRRFDAMDPDEYKKFIRHMELPMARVKKIMKIDDDVKQHMISQDAPLFLSAAAEIFIQEVTLKSWAIVEEGRRKTLQKCDIAGAISREEHFDFLIDIVPREEARKYQMNPLYEAGLPVMNEPQMQYVLADCTDAMGNNVYQLDNGQIIQATAIGQPIPITDPNGQIDLSQLPAGFQIVQLPGTM